MKKALTKIFWPLLKHFETGEVTTNYKKSHRVALIALGTLFELLALGSAAAAYSIGEFSALIAVIVFMLVGLAAIVVGVLGSDSAVSKIWGTK